MSPIRRMISIAVVLVLTGCTSAQQLAVERASREYNCPEDQIKTKYISTSHNHKIYMVKACGHIATYACSSQERGCLRESNDR